MNTFEPQKNSKIIPTTQDSEVLYKKLVDNMNEAVWMGDKNEKTIYANLKFCKMVGCSLEEIMGKESYDFWDAESVQKVKEVNQRKRKKGISSSYEGNLLTKDGTKIPVLINGTPLAGGGSIGIITDLSELKEKEESEKILSSAIQYSTDAIIIFDTNGEIRSWNKGAKIIFGYRQDEIINHDINQILSKDDINNILKNPGVLFNVELTGKHKNKRPIYISATLTPITTDTNKQSTYCLIIARDITNQMKFEEEMTLKYQKIKEAYNKFGIIRRQMDYIFEILELASNNSNQKTIADFIVSSIIMLTHVDGCVLRKFNSTNNTLELVSSFGLDEDWRGKSTVKFNGSLAKKAWTEQHSLKIIDISKEPKYTTPNLARKSNLCSLLLIPLQFKNKFVGSLSLYTSPDKKLEIFENEFIEKYSKLIEVIFGSMTA